MRDVPFPPTLPRIAGVLHRTIELPGLRMHVAEAGAGQPILLLHGFPQHWWEWRQVLPRLADHHVVCPDLRGAGWTDAPSRGYSRGHLLTDLVGLLDALGLERVRLVSHDMGAISAFALCLDHPDRVVSHVALGVPPPFLSLSPRLIPAFRHLWFEEALAVPGLGPRLLAGRRQRLPRSLFSTFGVAPIEPAVVEAYIAPLRQPERARAASALNRHLVLPEIGWLMGGRYKRVGLRTPTLILFGTQDAAFPPEPVRILLRDVDRHADHVELDFLDGAGHFLADDAPDQVAERALLFFERY
jgi:pimeloyl-ACP methyl ester carboxylesterase